MFYPLAEDLDLTQRQHQDLSGIPDFSRSIAQPLHYRERLCSEFLARLSHRPATIDLEIKTIALLSGDIGDKIPQGISTSGQHE